MLFENANKLYNLNIDYVELVLNKVIDVESNSNEEKSDKETDDEVHIPEALIYSVKPPAPKESPELTIPELPLLDVSEPIRVAKTSGETTSTLITKLRSRDIKFVRIAWVDYVNYTRYHAVSMERFAELVGSRMDLSTSLYPSERLADSGPRVAQDALGMQVDDVATPGVSTSGHYDLKPDFSTVWTPPFAKGHAYMMGRFFYKANPSGKELETCPRAILQRVIRQAEQELGVKFLVDFVTGFTLLQNGSPIQTGGVSASKFRCGSVADCMHEIVQNIVDSGIKLNTYNSKNISGYSVLHCEIVTGPLSPMQAADALVATREIIYSTAQKQNYRATLVPRLYSYQGMLIFSFLVSTSQIHISIQSASSDIPSNHPDVPSLPADLASFMSGLLTHLGSVCMFTLPLDACYPRVTDDPLNASVWACWGIENMEAPIRLCGSERGEFNVELRTFDGSANPYLGLAAILGAGMTGLKAQAALEMRDCGNVSSKDVPNTNYGHQRSVRLTQLAEDWRLKLGITTKMPTGNEVFAPETSERTEFINTWLPEEAWKLYKDVRNVSQG
ncbi:glutamine synthetase/guanido kinase [Ceratobasidium sp. AG-I]|nr:glutamine synthetase/guanido kinase [Ceratobasidium sp. AG-I]